MSYQGINQKRRIICIRFSYKGVDLDKRVLLITGATKGMGFAAALKFGENGYVVALSDNSKKDGNAAIRKLRDKGIEATFYQADVADEKDVGLLVGQVGEDYGKIDVLINNATVLGEKVSIEKMSSELYKKVIGRNLGSVFYCSRAAIPYLKLSGVGVVINLIPFSSKQVADTGFGLYEVTKAGVLAFTRVLAKELVSTGIRVNAISLCTNETGFNGQGDPSLMDEWRSGLSVDGSEKNEVVADFACFLSSDDYSYIVGEVIEINEGQMYL